MQRKWQDKFSSRSPQAESTLAGKDGGLGTVMYITGEDMEGRPQWAYALIHADKYLEFKAAEEKGNYKLSDYGEVLHFGPGAEPPEEVRKEMAEKYGCNEQFEDELEAMFEEALEQLAAEMEEFPLPESLSDTDKPS